ncbi:MAG: hypothetical protein BWY31_01970 [Lentisphaerae bacterium ADurb.Bin242]|nr:MAG: hypothetical protein BWY31_01970 [Lentisphaerae bacterium ADurb.Bin242]
MENKKTYFLFIHRNEKGLWGEFPDLDTCMAEGHTLEELMKEASDSLASYAMGVADLHGKMPNPSTIKELEEKAKRCRDKVIFIVPVTVYMPSLPARINVTSTEAKIQEITVFAKKVKKTRSELMVDATLEYIRSNA